MRLATILKNLCVFFLIATAGSFDISWAGEVYRSAFGFEALFPGQWIVLDQGYAKEHPESVESAFTAAQKDEEITPETKSTLKTIKEMLLRGEIEYYFSENPKFVVGVNKSTGTIPRTEEELQNLCKNLPSELSSSAGRPIKVYECSKKIFNGSDALMFIADGQNEGNRYVQYQVAAGPNTVIVFTATGASPEDFSKMVEIMESFMKTVRLATPKR